MKKISIILSVFLLIGLVSLSYAGQKSHNVPAAQAKTFIGTMSKITPGDPAKKIATIIIATGADQKEMTFHIRNLASITGTDAKPLAVNKLKEGDKVEIRYHTNEAGLNIVKSLKIVS